jgi:hypothetical protein
MRGYRRTDVFACKVRRHVAQILARGHDSDFTKKQAVNTGICLTRARLAEA